MAPAFVVAGAASSARSGCPRTVAALSRLARPIDRVYGDRIIAAVRSRAPSVPLVEAVKRPITVAVLDEVAEVLKTCHYTANIAAALEENRHDLEQMVLETVKNDPQTKRVKYISFQIDEMIKNADRRGRSVSHGLRGPQGPAYRRAGFLDILRVEDQSDARLGTAQGRPGRTPGGGTRRHGRCSCCSVRQRVQDLRMPLQERLSRPGASGCIHDVNLGIADSLALQDRYAVSMFQQRVAPAPGDRQQRSPSGKRARPAAVGAGAAQELDQRAAIARGSGPSSAAVTRRALFNARPGPAGTWDGRTGERYRPRADRQGVGIGSPGGSVIVRGAPGGSWIPGGTTKVVGYPGVVVVAVAANGWSWRSWCPGRRCPAGTCVSGAT